MGVSVMSTICYGIKIDDEKAEELFGEEYLDGDNIWRKHKGFQLEVYDYDKYKKWHDENPTPIEIECDGSDDEPVYIIAVPGTSIHAYWGDPQEILPITIDNLLQGVDGQKRYVEWRKFIEEIGLDPEEERWWLMSYYTR